MPCPQFGGAFLAAFVALALTAFNVPNFLAMLTDVDLPEHRGAAFGTISFSNGAAHAAGSLLTGVAVAALGARLQGPWNMIANLALFQIFFFIAITRPEIPSPSQGEGQGRGRKQSRQSNFRTNPGLCCLGAARTVPRDIAEVRATIAARAVQRIARK